MSTATQSRSTEPSTAKLDQPPTGTSAKTRRIPALDFTKGALVLIMVLYHWINYFVGVQWPYYDYIRFLTPSFIFISGFMISHIYLSKYEATDPQLSKRLIARGAKLLGVFLVLNVARDAVAPGPVARMALHNMISPRFLVTFFIFGDLPADGPKLVSFSILVPISYLLITSGALMLPYRRYKYTFHVVCVALLMASVVLGYSGDRNYNLEFVSIGMLGALIGFAPIEAIDKCGRHPYLLAAAYVGYLIAITIWGVPFLLLIVAVLLNLCILYLFGARGGLPARINDETILLGKYSLFGYISQVAILQLLSREYGRVHLGILRMPSSFLVAVALTIVSVEVVDRSRRRSKSAARIYKAIFA